MAVILGVAAIGLASYVYAPYVHKGPILCPLHAVFGLPCPGCGFTRAFCALAHGDLASALHYNALSMPVAAALLLGAVVAGYEAARGRATRWPRLLFSRRLAWVWAVIVITYHVGRVGVWAENGTLARDYLRTSYLYRIASTHNHPTHGKLHSLF